MSIFRPVYRQLSPAEAEHVSDIKARAEDLLTAISGTKTVCSSREQALARTKLEESVMWAVKSVTG